MLSSKRTTRLRAASDLVHRVRDRPRWASSLILVPDEAFRLFGDQDQVLGTPTTSCVVSLPIETPTRIVAEIIVDLEREPTKSLWLHPFVVTDRRIIWCSDDDEDDLTD